LLSINKNYLLNIYILLSIVIVFITGEKMSFILTIFGVGLFMLFDLKNNKNLLFGIISFLIIIFLFLNNPHIENEKLKKIHNRYNKDFKIALGIDVKKKFNERFFSNSVHFIHWATAFELFKQKPFFGHGIKQFRNKCLNVKAITLKNNYNINLDLGKNYRCTTHPHNFYLELISETGIISLMIILLLYIFYFKRILNLENRNYKISIFLCLLVYIFPIASTGSFFTNHNSFHFWFIISLVEFIYINQLRETNK